MTSMPEARLQRTFWSISQRQISLGSQVSDRTCLTIQTPIKILFIVSKYYLRHEQDYSAQTDRLNKRIYRMHPTVNELNLSTNTTAVPNYPQNEM